MDEFLCGARAMAPELIQMRRALHGMAEVGMWLPRTQAYVAQRLADMGCAVDEFPGGGLCARIGPEGGGPAFLLRADMDGLPMREQSGLPFAACGEAAHTCGHDLHMAMLLGAAQLLKRREGQLPGQALLLFQPAEETAEGMAALLSGGLLERYHPDAALGPHTAPLQPTGRVNCTSGWKTASFDRFLIRVRGAGGHGAMPHLCVDPITAAVQIHLALQGMISRECDPGQRCVAVIGRFSAGTAGNVIPECAELEGTLRASSAGQRGFMRERLEQIVQGTAQTARAFAQVEWLAGVPPIFCDEALTAELSEYAVQALGEELVDREPQRLSASEDFSLLGERIPITYFTIGTGLPEQGYAFGNHHPQVVYDEQAVPAGAAVLASCAFRWLRARGGAGAPGRGGYIPPRIPLA